MPRLTTAVIAIAALLLTLGACTFNTECPTPDACPEPETCPEPEACVVPEGTYVLTPELGDYSDFCTIRNLAPASISTSVPPETACGEQQTETASTRAGHDIVETVIVDYDETGPVWGMLVIELIDEEAGTITAACAYELVPSAP